MKEACDELLNLLQKSEAVLDHATRRMEEEFADRFDQTGVRTSATRPSLHSMLDCGIILTT